MAENLESAVNSEADSATSEDLASNLTRSASISDVDRAAAVPVISDSLSNLGINTVSIEEHPRAHEDKSHEKEDIQNIALELGTHLKELEAKREKEKQKESSGEAEGSKENDQKEEKEEAKEVEKEKEKEKEKEQEKEKEKEKPAPLAAKPAPAKVSIGAIGGKQPINFGNLMGGGSKKQSFGTMQVRPSKSSGAKTRNFNSLLRPKAKILPPDIKPNSVLVIDNGSGFIKAGVSGEALPRVVIPPAVGVKANGKDKYIGFKAWESADIKATTAIDINHGKVNWDYLGDLFEHIFYDELKVDPINHPMLLTELPDMTKQNKEKLCELMFEAFEIPSLYLANPAVMSLFSQGLVTGCVVDCGNRMQIVPVIDGYVIESARAQLPIGNITENLARLLTERGYYLSSSQTQLNIVRRIKERACYVAYDYEKEMKLYDQKAVADASFTMPDGHVLKLGNERFRAPESLFSPQLVGIDREGLHSQIYTCITKCPIDSRNELLEKVVLSGGSTLFPGLPERIKKELTNLVPIASQRKVNVIAPKNRKYSAWFGGSVFGTLNSYYDNCVWKNTFEEEGASCIHGDR